VSQSERERERETETDRKEAVRNYNDNKEVILKQTEIKLTCCRMGNQFGLSLYSIRERNKKGTRQLYNTEITRVMKK